MVSEDESCTAKLLLQSRNNYGGRGLKKNSLLCYARILLGSSYSLSGHSNKIGSWPKGYRSLIQFFCIASKYYVLIIEIFGMHTPLP